MERWGILGGSFDPIHNAHISLAQYAYNELMLTKVIFMPTFISPFKLSNKVTDATHRLAMVKAAIADYPYFECSDYEVSKEEPSYTAITLSEFANPSRELEFILGADSFLSLERWYSPEVIFDKARIACATRSGIQQEELYDKAKYYADRYNARCDILTMPDIDISSTSVREMIVAGKDYKEYLPAKVYDYIQEHKEIYNGQI